MDQVVNTTAVSKTSVLLPRSRGNGVTATTLVYPSLPHHAKKNAFGLQYPQNTSPKTTLKNRRITNLAKLIKQLAKLGI